LVHSYCALSQLFGPPSRSFLRPFLPIPWIPVMARSYYLTISILNTTLSCPRPRDGLARILSPTKSKE